jgi:hypothetical protein
MSYFLNRGILVSLVLGIVLTLALYAIFTLLLSPIPLPQNNDNSLNPNTIAVITITEVPGCTVTRGYLTNNTVTLTDTNGSVITTTYPVGVSPCVIVVTSTSYDVEK